KEQKPWDFRKRSRKNEPIHRRSRRRVARGVAIYALRRLPQRQSAFVYGARACGRSRPIVSTPRSALERRRREGGHRTFSGPHESIVGERRPGHFHIG